MSIALGCIYLPSAHATISLTPANGGTIGGIYTSAQTTQTTTTGTALSSSVNNYYYFVQYPGSPPVVAPAFFAPGFSPLDLSASISKDGANSYKNRFELTFTSTQPVTAQGTQRAVITLQIAPSASPPKFAPIATVNGSLCGPSTCQGQLTNGDFTAIPYPGANVPIRIGFYPSDICNDYTFIGGGTGQGCTTTSGTAATVTYPAPSPGQTPTPSSTPLTGSPTTMQLTFSVWLAPDSNPLTMPSGTPLDSMTTPLGMTFQVDSPQINCPTNPNTAVLFPGDTQVFFNTSGFTGSGLSGTAPMLNMWVVGQDTSKSSAAPDVSSTFNSGSNSYFFGPFTFGTANEPATRFVNSSVSEDHPYTVSFVAQDAAGVYTGNSACSIGGVRAASVQGFLAKSNCFIATAAFRSIDAEPVTLLRLFRDQILLNTELGTAFVHWYYRWSPPAAEWLMEHSVFRLPILLWLAPLEGFAWLCLHPVHFSLGLGFLAWVLLAVGRGGRKKKAGVLMILGILFFIPQRGHAEEEEESHSTQPFIDQIKKQLEEDEEPSGSYTESLKKNLENEKPTSSESYIDELKEDHPEKYSRPPKESYSEKEKEKLPVESSGGAIRAFEEGHSELEAKKIGDIHFAWGFRYGASVTPAVSAVGGYFYRPFLDVYGSTHAPNVNLFYEYQPFHSEWFGNFGLFASAGLGFYQGVGQYSYAVPKPGGGAGNTNGFYPLQSTIKFQFYQVPLTVGLNYRFNLLRILRPYIMAGPTVIGYVEGRSDGVSPFRGFSTALYYSVGVALSLDWLSPSTSWDLYQTHQIFHYYLTVDYSRFIPLTGPVSFQTSGIFAGLTYEF